MTEYMVMLLDASNNIKKAMLTQYMTFDQIRDDVITRWKHEIKVHDKLVVGMVTSTDQFVWMTVRESGLMLTGTKVRE